MAGEGFDPWNFVHLLWVGLASIVIWNGKQMFKRVENIEREKASDDDVKERHQENTERFNQISGQLDGLTHDLRIHREEINGSIHRISLDVNTLMERSRAALSKEDREAVAAEERSSGKSKK